MFKNISTLSDFDHEIWDAIQKELQRQEDHIELIASENYASPRVLLTQGSMLNNKYAEGYPAKRYYGGCEHVDIIENLAIERAKKLFDVDFANVQPHSGSQANAAAYFACIAPGDTIMGMDLASGGHLTHGAKVNFSGKIYNAIPYGLDDKTGEIDYVQVEKLARIHRPKAIMTGFSAYSRIVDWERFRRIADEVGAFLISDIAHVAGLIATGEYPSPIKIADVTTSTTHKTLRGPRSGLILARSNPAIEKKLNASVFPGLQGGPLCHVIAAKAVAFKEAMTPEFKIYQQQTVKNAKAMVKIVMQRGYEVVSGGTDNHLFLLSLIKKNITGKDALEALAKANITANKNSVPNDPRPPMTTSGLRLGTPAVTTRGFKENEIEIVANWICDILDDSNNQKTIDRIKKEVLDLCAKFPVYKKESVKL
ncbi:MAG: serine hydroxymethyltransferase [Coxiellaceae bacterium]|jgi:glycine hydroxymethyltransferase|nr:serine hydroxymethyltransferase [Coxiellaceae bacterium]